MTPMAILGWIVALTIGAVGGVILGAILSSARNRELRGEAKIQEVRAECSRTSLVAALEHHRQVRELTDSVQSSLEKQVFDARLIGDLERTWKNQLRDEIKTLNQLVTGAGEKLAGLRNELADWAAFGLHLQAWMGDVAYGPKDRVDRDETEGDLLAVQLSELLQGATPDPEPVITSIEEIHSDEEAGPGEEETTERAAVEA